MRRDIDIKVLSVLREMDERELHTRIIRPLLEAMGAQYIRYTHGSFERGKDFTYLAPSFYGTKELVVCQVKSEKLTGRASTPSQSTTAFLIQAQQCKHVAVLNPATNSKQTPDRIVLITTYPLPDAPLADADTLLSQVRSDCTIIGPEDLLRLIREHLGNAYSEIAFPGNSIALALQRYVMRHHEADAFDISALRPLDSFYVNIGVSCDDSMVGRLLDRSLRSGKSGNMSILGTHFFSLWHLQKRLIEATKGRAIIGMNDTPEGEGAVLSRPPARNHTVVAKRPSDAAIRSLLSKYITRQANAVRASRDKSRRVRIIAETLNCVTLADELLNEIATCFRWTVDSADESMARTTTLFREIDPNALLDTHENVCISGQAGAGKTCLARMVASLAMERGLSCLYFPCSIIQSADEPLLDAMHRFLSTLAPDIAADDIQSLIETANVFVIDGCDESASYKTRLMRDIESLAAPKSVNLALTPAQKRKIAFPKYLRRAIRFRETGDSEHVVTASTPLAESDLIRLVAWNANTDAEVPLKALRASLQATKRRVVITMRNDASVTAPRSFGRLSLSPFDDEQVIAFFRTWCQSTEISPDPILEFLEGNPYIFEICRTPINATIVAAAFQNGYDLPHSRVEVYHKRFELLLDKWDRARRIPGRNTILKSDKYRFLSRLALAMHSRHSQTFSISQAEETWQGGFARLYPDYSIDDVLGELCHANNVIFPEGCDKFSLGHLSYQEFLVAHAVSSGQHVEILAHNMDDPWWHQVALFYAGIAGDIGRLVAIMQRRTGIRNPRHLLTKMMDEARYTTEIVRTVICDLRSAGLVDTEWPYEEQGDWPGGVESEDEVEDAPGVEDYPEMFSRLCDMGDHWGQPITIPALGEGELVVETDEGPISDEQKYVIGMLAEFEELGPRCIDAVVKVVSDDVPYALEASRTAGTLDDDFPELCEGDSVSSIVRKNVGLQSITVPVQYEGENAFDVYMRMYWREDTVVALTCPRFLCQGL